MEYFFAEGSEQRGPYALEQLLSLGLKTDTLVWRDGLAEWTRAGALPELAALFASAPITPAVASPGIPAPIPALAYQSPLATGGNTNGMAIAGMVLGIVALVTIICDGFGLIPGILAIIFGVLARKQIKRSDSQGYGMATAGLICGSIAVALVVLGVTAFIIFLVTMQHYSPHASTHLVVPVNPVRPMGP